MSLTHNVGLDLMTVGKPHARNLSKSRVWLLGSHRRYLDTHTTLERGTLGKGNLAHFDSIPRVLERRRFTLLALLLATFADKLVHSWHVEKDANG